MSSVYIPFLVAYIAFLISAEKSHVEAAVKRGGRFNVWEQNTHATFYGGSDASGTMGGACGYGNLYQTGYGTDTAAGSISIFANGFLCGACYEVMCVEGVCRRGRTVTITITNLCPQGSEGGWCDAPKHHLDMAAPAWLQIGSDLKGGVITTRMRRVLCSRKGGVRFLLTGNPWFLQVMVSNVAGSGDISSLAVSSNGGITWIRLDHNWGAIWSVHSMLGGKSLTFRLRGRMNGRVLVARNVAPAGWSLGATYEAKVNFPGRPRRRVMEIKNFNITEYLQ